MQEGTPSQAEDVVPSVGFWSKYVLLVVHLTCAGYTVRHKVSASREPAERQHTSHSPHLQGWLVLVCKLHQPLDAVRVICVARDEHIAQPERNALLLQLLGETQRTNLLQAHQACILFWVQVFDAEQHLHI